MSAELERRPGGTGWVEIPGRWPSEPGVVVSISAWQRGMVCVVSSLDIAEYPSGIGEGPQWHISIARIRKRPRPEDVTRALRAFDMVGAEEDNHHPGVARHFWLPVDPSQRVDCECKVEETVVVDPDGYRWTNPKEGPCRGCEVRPITGKACPLHPEAAP